MRANLDHLPTKQQRELERVRTTLQWTSVRKLNESKITTDLSGFLTTEPSDHVKPVHPKAMPVILTEPDEIVAWKTASRPVARVLQRPLAGGALVVI